MSNRREDSAKRASPPFFAPPGGRKAAIEDGEDLNSGHFCSRKSGFMTMLVDKLKFGRGRAGAAKREPASFTLDPDVRDLAGGTAVLSSDSGGPNSGRDSWLAETRVCNSSFSKPMKFTYPPGSTPLARYTIRRGIGVGGFGEVYFALTDAGKEVALKRIQRNLEVELRGAQHCLNLKHPNLVSLHDICRDEDDQWWVVMEFIAGKNLREILDESPDGLDPSEARRWFESIAAGVGHLHSSGLVHRDLKPGNVFDDLGIVKVGDYGLSKFIAASHKGGHTESVGTFHYMAPEIGRGQYGREIDIYAMGIVLYELLTGRVPFDGESCHEIIVKHMTATPDLTGIDQPYRSTIRRALEKDPAKRFSTIEQMLDSLGMDSGASPSNGPVSAGPINQTATHFGSNEVPIEAKLVDEFDSPQPFAPQPFASQTVPDGDVITAEVVPYEEPLARAVGQSFDDLKLWWRSLDQSPAAKAFLAIAAGFVLMINTHWLLPLLSILGMVYVPYYIVRQMVLHVRQQPSYAQAQRLAGTPPQVRGKLSTAQWRDQMRMGLRAKHSIHRVAELNTSWIAATLTVAGLAVVAGIIGLRTGPVTATTIAPFGWMFTTVLVASLGLLGLGKLWERDEGEALPRRLVLAGVGAGVGAIAFAMNDFLMLPMTGGLGRDVDATTLPQALYQPDGVPMASAMMAHYALLFAAMRWWKPVDPLRKKRLGLWTVAVAVVFEWGVHQVLPIPQPMGLLVAGATAITVQMSAPWINPRRVPMTTEGSQNPAQLASARSLA